MDILPYKALVFIPHDFLYICRPPSQLNKPKSGKDYFQIKNGIHEIPKIAKIKAT